MSPSPCGAGSTRSRRLNPALPEPGVRLRLAVLVSLRMGDLVQYDKPKAREAEADFSLAWASPGES